MRSNYQLGQKVRNTSGNIFMSKLVLKLEKKNGL